MAAAPRNVGGAGHEHSLLESLTKRVASSSTLYLSLLFTVSNNGPLLPKSFGLGENSEDSSVCFVRPILLTFG